MGDWVEIRLETGFNSDHLGRLIRDGRPSDAVLLADSVAARAPDAGEYCSALLMKFGALLNLNRVAECASVSGQVMAGLQRHEDQALLGEFHALAAHLAHSQGSLETCLTHLVRGGQALEKVKRLDGRAAMAWLDLAVTYSRIGLHKPAIEAFGRCHDVVQRAALDPTDFRHPEISIRAAISLDHRGDTAASVRFLRGVVTTMGSDDVAAFERPYLGYALARLAALGIAIPRDPRPLLAWADMDVYPEINELRRLAKVCLAIADHEPAAALRTLDQADVAFDVVGEAEVTRLRTLAHLETGDHRAAYRTERTVTRILTRNAERIQGLFLSGMSNLLEQDARPVVGEAPASRHAHRAAAVDVLLQVPAMADAQTRQAIVERLPPEIRHSIRRFPAARLDVDEILGTCADHANGVAELIEAIIAVAGDSLAARRATEALRGLAMWRRGR